MGDKPGPIKSEEPNLPSRNSLLDAALGKPFVAKALAEVTQSALVPYLVLTTTTTDTAEPTPQQRQAIRYYSETKFPESDDQKRFPSNAKALELAKKNILLHEDGVPTIKDGRIVDVKLTDPAERAMLNAWLIFPVAYKDAERTLSREGLLSAKDAKSFADFNREGFRLALKRDGFDADGKVIPKGLTAVEQIKLDCLTFKTLRTQLELGQPLTPFEQKAMTEAAERLNKLIASDKPDEFIKKFKGLLASCTDSSDRKILLIGLTALLSDDKFGKPAIESFEKWLTTKYTDALDQKLYKDPQKLKDWLEINDKDALKKFPEKPSQENLLAWLRSRHTEALGLRWRDTMGQLTQAADQGAFQDCTNIVLGKEDRFGAAAGLFAALNNVALRKDGDTSKPADTDKVVAAITEAGNDPKTRRSNARQPGEFVTDPIAIPEEAQPPFWRRALRATLGNALMIGLGIVALDVLGAALVNKTIGRFFPKAKLEPGWTKGPIKEAFRAARDTADFTSGGKLGWKDPVLKYKVPGFEEMINSSERAAKRPADPRTVEEALRGIDGIKFKGLELVLPNGKTARDVVRELRRLESDKDFRKFLDDQIKEAKDAKDDERARKLEEKKTEYEGLTPAKQALARRQVIEEIFDANTEMMDAAKKSEGRWRTGRIAGMGLLAVLALGYAIKAISDKQDDTPPPLIPPKVKTK